jgi:hypothetical protein
MIKVYEMKGMNACKMSIEHKGVTINLSFENGDISSKRNARLTTENRFVQDAIEAMPTFGTRIVLVHAVEKSVAMPVEVEEEERSPRARRHAARGAVAKKAPVVENGATVVAEVKNVNDAAAYFMEKGITVESKEQLKELMQKHDVEFPNLVME